MPIVLDGSGSITGLTDAYRFVQTVTFTSSGTFTKETYPWLRAIRVKVQGAGGGGGGAVTTGAGGHSMGGPGGGGGYAESFITDIASLASSVTVTVGTGGAGGTGSSGGSTGGNSSFGSLVIGDGGGGGGADAFTTNAWGNGAGDGSGGTGDLVIFGGEGNVGLRSVSNVTVRGASGGSRLAGSRRGEAVLGSNGLAGRLYGGGGTAGANAENQGTARTGGAGANGIVILELFA